MIIEQSNFSQEFVNFLIFPQLVSTICFHQNTVQIGNWYNT